MTKQDHEAAALFPLLDEQRFGELVESIREEGLLHEVVLCEGKILDGRNRYRACLKAGVEPRFEKHEGDPFAYVWAANGQRRDLSVDQRATIFVLTIKKSSAWQAKQAEIAAAANMKRAEATKGRERKGDGTLAQSSGASSRGTTGPKRPERSTAAKAAASGTNRPAIERAEKLVKDRPDLAQKVASGEVKPAAARREMKKAEVAKKVEALPEGKYRVIYADPPWQYNDSREGLGAGSGATEGVDRASTAAKDHYPTMSMSELAALDVKSMAADDCVLFCWATAPLLPEQIELTKAWGFKYKTFFVWDKGKGSFGHYHTAEAEILLICTRGSGTPDISARENQVQRWPRGAHSRKPEEARDMIDRLYPKGARVELFRRGDAPDGWVVWGNEAEQQSEAA